MSNRRRPRNIYGKPQSSHDKPDFNPRLVQPTVVDGKISTVVVLDRIEPEVEPPYCTHGKTTCYACGDWCWLGHETYEAVLLGAAGVCLECAIRTMPPGLKPDGHLNDTLHHE